MAYIYSDQDGVLTHCSVSVPRDWEKGLTGLLFFDYSFVATRALAAAVIKKEFTLFSSVSSYAVMQLFANLHSKTVPSEMLYCVGFHGQDAN